jgi:hypothetical protein
MSTFFSRVHENQIFIVLTIFHLDLKNVASERLLSRTLQRQFIWLRIYSLGFWAFYSLLVVFQPLYLAFIGFPLWGIFLNGALGAIATLIFSNYWSKRADEKQSYKGLLIVGNLFIAGAMIFILYVRTLWMMFILTLILRSGPFSDGFVTTLVYRLSDQISSDENDDPVERKFHNINLFAQFRKFGSVGWAIMLPFAGLLVNIYGLGINFIVGAIGFVLISILFAITIREDLILGNLPTLNIKTAVPSQSNNSLWQDFGEMIQNKMFFILLLATFLFSAATVMTYEVQGLFFSLFANDNYILVVLAFSVAAFVEWPSMGLVAARVKKVGWQKMISVAYILTGVRLALMPMIIIFAGNIWWGYCLQVLAGIIFGFRQPAVTYGTYICLKKHQKALGQSFLYAFTQIGAFFGYILGAITSLAFPVRATAFIGLHWVAAIIAIGSGLVFIYGLSKNHKYL